MKKLPKLPDYAKDIPPGGLLAKKFTKGYKPGKMGKLPKKLGGKLKKPKY